MVVAGFLFREGMGGHHRSSVGQGSQKITRGHLSAAVTTVEREGI